MLKLEGIPEVLCWLLSVQNNDINFKFQISAPAVKQKNMLTPSPIWYYQHLTSSSVAHDTSLKRES